VRSHLPKANKCWNNVFYKTQKEDLVTKNLLKMLLAPKFFGNTAAHAIKPNGLTRALRIKPTKNQKNL